MQAVVANTVPRPKRGRGAAADPKKGKPFDATDFLPRFPADLNDDEFERWRQEQVRTVAGDGSDEGSDDDREARSRAMRERFLARATGRRDGAQRTE